MAMKDAWTMVFAAAALSAAASDTPQLFKPIEAVKEPELVAARGEFVQALRTHPARSDIAASACERSRHESAGV